MARKLRKTLRKNAKSKIVKRIDNNEKKLIVLIILILLIIIIDIISFYVYNLGNSNFDESLKCKDGTPYNSCSKEKPLYCYNGELVKKAFTCGCPKGYKIDFQDCKRV